MQPLPCGFIFYHVGGRDGGRLDAQVLKSQAAARPILFLRSQFILSYSKVFLSLRCAVADLPLFVLHGSASEICIPHL